MADYVLTALETTGSQIATNSKSNCKSCARRHHTSLCKDKLKSQPLPEEQSRQEENIYTEKKDTAMLHSSHIHTDGPVLLNTVVAEVQAHSTYCEANILFDEGAQRSFITDKLSKKLNLRVAGRETHYLSGFGEKNRQVRHLETAMIALRTENKDIEIKVLIVPEIAVPLKTYQGAVNKLPYLQDLKLAHPMNKDDIFEITLLIGADYYWRIVQDKVVGGNGPTAVKSKLGYLLSGPLNTFEDNPHHTSTTNLLASHVSEEIDLEKFWKIGSLGIETEKCNQSYDDYMTNYKKSSVTYSEEDRKYYAKLPWKENHKPLPTNEIISRRRTRNVINRLQREPSLLKKYGEIIAEQERLGFIEKVPDDVTSPKMLHYIPHLPIKKDSATTPIRIVYDCSCRSSQGSASLNDCLQGTPPILNDLSSILMHFRIHQYAVTTDIVKAFLNVGLSEDDRDVTRFFWLSGLDDPSSDLQVYRCFKSMLFGTTCSLFILSAVLQKHLSSNQCAIREQLSRDLYVDNILSSLPDHDTLMEVYHSSRDIFKGAGFKLRSWASNYEILRETARSENVADDCRATKVLGMVWNPESDIITFAKSKRCTSNLVPMTKRELLKESSSIYDPLGILSPLTVRSKILMQSLWQQKLEWDEPLPAEIVLRWHSMKADINEGIKTELPRCYFSKEFKDLTKLHVFTDSSMKANGAYAYIISGNESSLVIAKNRVAPIKTLTIPKLELMAAVVGAKLADHIQKSIQCTKIIFWSDSQVVLKWLTSSKQQNTFVNNRIKKIKELSGDSEWRYCPTDSNPTDLLSRGITFDIFQNNQLWLHEPSWLINGAITPIYNTVNHHRRRQTINHLKCDENREFQLLP
ncbi:uncharacterized protein LOC123558686 [Mercenaria mercenaria]|uniref:uncharacterized protein LOC123558686 n=1 Tax=Mercenaria mercenaria TaxID=6596 RepID=UPI00234F57C7|nr:uncharacterized protein LOC123558686 [Mercenaria mercenaria]